MANTRVAQPKKIVSYAQACTPEFRAWMRKLSEKTKIKASVISREALREWALRRGHAGPPPR
jgi:hypothetical protein